MGFIFSLFSATIGFRNKENANYVQSFLNVTFAGQANFENENGRSNHDLGETLRELDKFGRDYFLICAHVEADERFLGRSLGRSNYGDRKVRFVP